MAKEDEEWERLKEKWLKEEIKPPEERKKIQLPKLNTKVLIAVGLVVLCSSTLFVFLKYFNFFTLVVYNDVNEVLGDVIASERNVKYSLSGLPAGHCYWVRPMYNESGYFVEIIEYRSEDSCIGVITNKTVLHLDSALNIGTSDCICSKNDYTVSKTLNEYGIYLRMVEI